MIAVLDLGILVTQELQVGRSCCGDQRLIESDQLIGIY
jgi:hypothetical protein